jgi:hypothetical protein
MLNQKNNLIILFIFIVNSLVSVNAVANGLSTEDYLCAIFPPNCPKVKKSTELNPIRLTLSTEMGGSRSNVTDRLITFEFARAYITWGPTLTEKAQSHIKIVAAIPDLLPYEFWKDQMIEKAKDNNMPAKQLGKFKNELHKHWLPIELMTYSQTYNYCYKEKCFDSNVALNKSSQLEWKSKLLKEDNDFKYYVASRVTNEWKSYEAVLIPKKLKEEMHFFMVCDINKSTTYNWCKSRSMFDKNIALSYWFEVKYLNRFYELDSNIRKFVRKAIISDTNSK